MPLKASCCLSQHTNICRDTQLLKLFKDRFRKCSEHSARLHDCPSGHCTPSRAPWWPPSLAPDSNRGPDPWHQESSSDGCVCAPHCEVHSSRCDARSHARAPGPATRCVRWRGAALPLLAAGGAGWAAGGGARAHGHLCAPGTQRGAWSTDGLSKCLPSEPVNGRFVSGSFHFFPWLAPRSP